MVLRADGGIRALKDNLKGLYFNNIASKPTLMTKIAWRVCVRAASLRQA